MKPTRQNADTLDMVGMLMGNDDGIEMSGIKAFGLAAPLNFDSRQTCIKKDLSAFISNPDGIAFASAGQNANSKAIFVMFD